MTFFVRWLYRYISPFAMSICHLSGSVSYLESQHMLFLGHMFVLYLARLRKGTFALVAPNGDSHIPAICNVPTFQNISNNIIDNLKEFAPIDSISCRSAPNLKPLISRSNRCPQLKWSHRRFHLFIAKLHCPTDVSQSIFVCQFLFIIALMLLK